MTSPADQPDHDKILWELAQFAAEMFLDEADRCTPLAIDMAMDHEAAMMKAGDPAESTTARFLSDPAENDLAEAPELARRIVVVLRRSF